MKKMLGMVMVLGLVLVFSGVAMAQYDTASIAVTANVVGNCKFSGGADLTFGALDPGSGDDGAASDTTTFWCTKNATYTITSDNGLYGNRMRHATTITEFIPYTLTYNPPSGTGNGPGNPITLNISGTVPFANYQNAAVGDYGDTVVLTIAP